MQVGVFACLLIGVVDYLDTVTGYYTGNRGLLAPYLLALEGLLLVPLAGALGVWIAFCTAVTRPLRERYRHWLRTGLIALPWGLAFAYIPTGWVAEHWSQLPTKGKAIAVAVFPAIFFGTWFVTEILDRLVGARAAADQPRWRAQLVAVAVLLVGALCYWADRTLFVGLYDDFHFGLALICISALSLGAYLVSALSIAEQQLHWPGPKTLAALLVTALSLVVGGEVLRPHLFGPSRSLIFSKVVAVGRTLTDFDRDGASHLLGGSDCAPFDASRAPGNLDEPENGLDEDCSGRDTTWPGLEKRAGHPMIERPKFNILMISIDALRADHLGAYGYPRKTSPNIDRLAAQSVRFSRAFSASTKTIEALPSLISGLYPSNIARHYDDEAVHAFLTKKAEKAGKKRPQRGGELWYRVDDSVELIPETLHQLGYDTAVMTVAFPVDVFGIDQGVDQVQMTKRLTEVAEANLWRISGQGKPFFMWLHFNGPHEPYEQHEGFHFGDRPIDRYDSEIANDDSHVGALLDALRDLSHEDDTVIVLTADHGEEFGDHGGHSHGMKLYRELLNVPLLLKIPGVAPRVIDTPVELVDLAPTFCELLKAKESCQGYDGQSLLAALADRREPTRGAYSELFHGPGRALRRALFDGRWRLVDDLERDRRELYDHETDVNEHYDVSQWHPDVVADMMERIALRPLLRRAPASP